MLTMMNVTTVTFIQLKQTIQKWIGMESTMQGVGMNLQKIRGFEEGMCWLSECVGSQDSCLFLFEEEMMYVVVGKLISDAAITDGVLCFTMFLGYSVYHSLTNQWTIHFVFCVNLGQLINDVMVYVI